MILLAQFLVNYTSQSLRKIYLLSVFHFINNLCFSQHTILPQLLLAVVCRYQLLMIPDQITGLPRLVPQHTRQLVSLMYLTCLLDNHLDHHLDDHLDPAREVILYLLSITRHRSHKSSNKYHVNGHPYLHERDIRQ